MNPTSDDQPVPTNRAGRRLAARKTLPRAARKQRTGARLTRGAIPAFVVFSTLAIAEPAEAAAVSWPTAWEPYTFSDGAPILSTGGDVNPGYADLWSGAARGEGSLPTVYYGTDGSNAFFRLRVADDPEATKGGEFSSNVWLVQIAVDGTTVASVGLDAKPAGVNDYVYAIDPLETTTVTPYAPVIPDGGQSGGARVVSDGLGGFFVDFQVPIDAITSVSPALDASTPVQLFFGSSTTNTGINKDYMSGDAVSFVGLSTVTLDGSPVGDVETQIAITSAEVMVDSNPVLSGTGEAGATVELTLAGQTFRTTVAEDGTWSIEVPVPLADGSYPVSATAIDSAGNTATAAQILTVDSTTTVAISSAAATADATPVLSGSGEAGATVELTIGDQTLSTLVAEDGAWSIEVPVPLADGGHDVAVTATDPLGNTAEATQLLAVDTLTVVAITSPRNTADSTPVLAGTGEPGAAIAATVAGQTLSTTVGDDGSWAVEVPAALADGAYDVSVATTDELGNVAAASQVLTVDTATTVAITSQTATADSTPVLSGTGEAGATVEVTVAGQILSTTIDPDGSWSAEVPSALPDGDFGLTATATDALGNTATTTSALTIDTSTSVTIDGPGATDDPTPTLSGTGEPGATIEITVADQTLTGTVAGSGTWSITVPAALEDGSHPVAVTATDHHGNVDSAVGTLVVDTRTTVGVTSDSVTADPVPVFAGTGEPEATVTVSVGGQDVSTVVDQDGTWSAGVLTALSDGVYDAVITATDTLGNAASTSQTIVVDTSTTVAISSKSITDDSTPTISGTGEPLASVEVLVGGQRLETTVDATGTWSVAVPTELADGRYDIEVTATDQIGNTATTSQQLVVDATTHVTILSSPVSGSATPTVSGLAEAGAGIVVVIGDETLTTSAGTDGTWSVTATDPLVDGTYLVPVTATAADVVGNSAEATQMLTVDTTTEIAVTSASATTDATPVLSGTGEAGATIDVVIGGHTLTTTVSAGGTWSVPVTMALDDGTYDVSVTATDALGNIVVQSHPLTVDSRTSVAILSAPSTADATPTLFGTSEPGAAIELTIDGQTLTATVADDGTWSIEVPLALVDGVHAAAITATDALGNTASTTQMLDVDTVNEVAITSAMLTADAAPVLAGTGEAGSTVTVFLDGLALTARVGSDGTWLVGVPVELADGVYRVDASSTDLVGNAADTTQMLTVDTATDVTVIGEPATADSSPLLAGTGEAGSTIIVVVDGQELSTTVAQDGSWSVQVPVALADGAYEVQVTATDAIGNTASASQTLAVDTATELTLSSDAAVADATPEFSGMAEPGATITVQIAGQTVTTAAGLDGTWAVALETAIVDGTHEVVVTGTDELGNSTSETSALMVDTTATLTSPVIGPIANPTPTIDGTAEPGSRIAVSVDGEVHTTTASRDGSWAITVVTPLADGLHDVVVATADPLGNTAVLGWTLVIDTTAEIQVMQTLTGEGPVQGAGEPGSVVTVTVDGVSTVVTVGEDGTWAVPMPSDLAPGLHTIEVQMVDALGNVESVSFVAEVPGSAAATPDDVVTETVELRNVVAPEVQQVPQPEFATLPATGLSMVAETLVGALMLLFGFLLRAGARLLGRREA